MDIIFLKQLRDNPSARPDSVEYKSTNKSLSIEEIELLESEYNDGNDFPKVLKELLFLAGKFCYVLDYGLNTSQGELQEFVREMLEQENQNILRPFYAVDVYNAYDQFLFIYLDEGDNPPLYEGYYGKGSDPNIFTRKVQASLTDLINKRIERVKKGSNPF